MPLPSLDTVTGALKSGESYVSIAPHERTSADENEFLIFLKPTVTHAMLTGNAGAWAAMKTSFDTYRVEVFGVAIMTGREIARRRLVRDHYGLINAVSERGVDAFNDLAHEELGKLREKFGPMEVYGGHQFLARRPDLTPAEVTAIFQSGELHRLASGTYGVVVHDQGEQILLLNGFHPEQVAVFEDDASSIVLIQGRSQSSWRTLRQDMIGPTDPRKASEHSLRGLMLSRAEEFGIAPVTSLRNGIHMSAGPIEAMVELARFMVTSQDDVPLDEAIARTSLGAVLTGQIGAVGVEDLSQNRVLERNNEFVSSFDATEDVDTTALLSGLADGTYRFVDGDAQSS